MAIHAFRIGGIGSRVLFRGAAATRYVHIPPRVLPMAISPSRIIRFQPLTPLIQKQSCDQRKSFHEVRTILHNGPEYHAPALNSSIQYGSKTPTPVNPSKFWRSLPEYNRVIGEASKTSLETGSAQEVRSIPVAIVTKDITFPDSIAWKDVFDDKTVDSIPQSQAPSSLAPPEALISNPWVDTDTNSNSIFELESVEWERYKMPGSFPTSI
ncbi:hypothetical protein H072_252 [Dactylellina haptotyla CBS 200.50]|uniref:Uncharacterized protein n=1 Tax=Dactylellina haptotyla (strain CBS 200.50) TaxID=1284197 RepID=S8AS61_DACHA|nr:hypothetical protein H072_252 [Dactylellina haptotyla CBS 200.50]